MIGLDIGALEVAERGLRTGKVALGLGGIEEAIVSASKMEKARLIVLKADDDRDGTSFNEAGGKTDITLWCQFNPTSLTISKKVGWGPADDPDLGSTGKWVRDENQVFTPAQAHPGLTVPPIPPNVNWKYIMEKKPVGNRNTPGLKFSGGQPASFGLELFFDTTQESVSGLIIGGDKRDVRRYTNDLLALTLGPKIDGKNEVHNPPTVLFVWGKLLLFEAVVTEVELTYMLFDPDGTPVRAKAMVGFLQSDKYDNEAQNPTTRTEPRKTWVVQQGDTVHHIATSEYGHPAHWRHIADSNNLHNPLALRPGQVLILPPLA